MELQLGARRQGGAPVQEIGWPPGVASTPSPQGSRLFLVTSPKLGVRSSPNCAFWFLLASAVAAIAAGFSAWAAVSIRNLTRKLVRVTQEYADTMHEELLLLRREAEPKLFLDVRLLANNQCELTCIHLGAAGSHSVMIGHVETVLESSEAPGNVLEREEVEFHDLVSPGKRWSKLVTVRIGQKLTSLPRPNIFTAIVRWKMERKLAAYLAVRVDYKVADECQPPVQRQYQVIFTSVGAMLKPVG